MIPAKFISKMGKYRVNLNGLSIQAQVAENEEMVNVGFEELRSSLNADFPIVGFDLKYNKCSSTGNSYSMLLVLFVKDRCLLVQLSRLCSPPPSLYNFLNNQSICFLGVNVSQKIGILKGSSLKFVINSFKTAVDIGTFAAKGLQNPSLKGCTNLVDLSSRVGLSILKEEAFAETDHQGGAFSLSGLTTTSQLPDWGTSVCFSKEEVKYAMFEAYMCYTTGTKIMTTL